MEEFSSKGFLFLLVLSLRPSLSFLLKYSSNSKPSLLLSKIKPDEGLDPTKSLAEMDRRENDCGSLRSPMCPPHRHICQRLPIWLSQDLFCPLNRMTNPMIPITRASTPKSPHASVIVNPSLPCTISSVGWLFRFFGKHELLAHFQKIIHTRIEEPVHGRKHSVHWKTLFPSHTRRSNQGGQSSLPGNSINSTLLGRKSFLMGTCLGQGTNGKLSKHPKTCGL